MSEDEEKQPPPQARHPLGIGSKFSVSADGRLQQGPRSVDRQQGPQRTWTEASGALQGVSPPPTTSDGPSPATDTFSDAIMLSRGSKNKGPASLLWVDETSSRGGDFEVSADSLSRVPPPFMSSGSGEPDDSPAWDGGGSSSAADADDSGVAAVPKRPFKVTTGKAEKPKNEAQIKREKHLVAQIKELERQLEKETLRKKEQAKVSKRKERRRLVVCSRWLPFGLQRDAEGRLQLHDAMASSRSSKVSAYETVLHRFDVTWVGCPSEEIAPEEVDHTRDVLDAKSCVPVLLPPEQAERAEVLSAEVIWPLFHYIPLSMLESDTDMIHQRWEDYTHLNKAFATEISKMWKKGDIILVHDYHLMLLPALLRESHPKAEIGWFLHTPFPSAEIYQTLPLRKEILRGVLAANLIGFQIYDYVRHFMNAASRVLGTDVSVESKYILDATHQTAVTVDAFPCGIDRAKFEKMLDSSELKDKVYIYIYI